jgi:hypothetical protein
MPEDASLDPGTTTHSEKDATEDDPASQGATTGSPGCARRYADVDRDGFGDPRVVSARCDLGPDWVSDATDCDDANAEVYPGQPAAFAVHRGDGSFDYDCDGRNELETEQLGACALAPGCTPGTDGVGWWHGTIAGAPGCGGQQAWLLDCTPSGPACDAITEMRVQRCR